MVVRREEERTTVDRYKGRVRVNHWLTAACLILLGISGLSLFHPSMFFLSGLFGGGSMTRMLHPWIGCVLLASFAVLFVQMWRLNLWNKGDIRWILQINDAMTGNEEAMPLAGKYNAGQKVVFWSMTFFILVLFGSGLMIWYEYFGSVFTIEQQRFGHIIHALAAVVILLVLIAHVYAGIYVRGTLSAMTEGKVTGGWAFRHHRLWLRDEAAKGVVDERKDGRLHNRGGVRPAE
jgi:formate dehydrogenase subunit gamma